MCLQCLTESEMFGKKGDWEVLPGWFLVRATKDYMDDWKAGEYGLVIMNDPECVWSGQIYKEPHADKKDEELTKEEREEWYLWHKEVFNLLEALNTICLDKSIRLVESMKAVGLDILEKPNGILMAEWLMNHFAEWIETHPAVPEE